MIQRTKQKSDARKEADVDCGLNLQENGDKLEADNYICEINMWTNSNAENFMSQVVWLMEISHYNIIRKKNAFLFNTTCPRISFRVN